MREYYLHDSTRTYFPFKGFKFPLHRGTRLALVESGVTFTYDFDSLMTALNYDEYLLKHERLKNYEQIKLKQLQLKSIL